MSSSKKIDLRHMFICLRPRTPYLPHPCIHTVYLFTQGKGGGGELNQRAGERGNSSQSWVKNTNMTDWISSLQTLFYEGLGALTLTRFV